MAENCLAIGLHYKKNFTGGVTGNNPLQLGDARDLLIVDMDYFLDHLTDVILAVKSVKNI